MLGLSDCQFLALLDHAPVRLLEYALEHLCQSTPDRQRGRRLISDRATIELTSRMPDIWLNRSKKKRS